MKIKWGALVVDGRNKIGGHVASKNHFGAYLRTKVTPSNPSTPAQSSARTRMLSIAAAWRALTSAQISVWENILSQWKKSDIFGDFHAMTAINLFQMLNNNALRAGGSLMTSPQVLAAISNLGAVSVAVVSDTSVLITCALQALGQNEVLEVFATPDIQAGKRFVKSEYRIITSIGTLVAGVCTATTAYEAKFGSVYGSDDTRIYVKVRIVNSITGQAGIPVSAFAQQAP